MIACCLFVPDVPGLCRGLCRGFHSCAGCAGSPMYARAPHKTKTTSHKNRVPLRICTRHTRHTRHTLDSYTYFHASSGTHSGTPGTDTSRACSPLIFSFKKDVMEDPNQTRHTRCIRCTPENAPAMRQAVEGWHDLYTLVKELQAQGVFPGLRGLTITLTGSEEMVGKGLAAVTELNAVKAV